MNEMSYDWFWLDGKEWKSYSDKNTALINAAFSEGKHSIVIDTTVGPYVVHLRPPFSQSPKGDERRIRHVEFRIRAGSNYAALPNAISVPSQNPPHTSHHTQSMPNGGAYTPYGRTNAQDKIGATHQSFPQELRVSSSSAPPETHEHGSLGGGNVASSGQIPPYIPGGGVYASNFVPAASDALVLGTRQDFPPPSYNFADNLQLAQGLHQRDHMASVGYASFSYPPSIPSALDTPATPISDPPVIGRIDTAIAEISDRLALGNTHRNSSLNQLIVKDYTEDEMKVIFSRVSASYVVGISDVDPKMPELSEHLVSASAPNAKATQFQLWERVVQLTNISPYTLNWSIVEPTYADEYVFFSCVHRRREDEMESTAPNGTWQPTHNPFSIGGTLNPNESTDLLVSVVFFHPKPAEKRNKHHKHKFFTEGDFVFTRLVHIKVQFQTYSGYTLLAVIAEGQHCTDKNITYWHVPREEVTLGESVGKGSYGSVYKASIRGLECAMKLWLPNQKETKKTAFPPTDFSAELKFFPLLSHRHIIPFIGAYQSPSEQECFILLKFAKENLRSYYERKLEARQWTSELAIKLALQAARGFKYLHTLKLVHRDVKSLNIMVDEDGDIRIIDLGCTRTVQGAMISKSLVGTKAWVAPEVYNEKPNHTPAADVFSYGVLLYELATATVAPPRTEDEIRLGFTKPLVVEDFVQRFPAYVQLYSACVQPQPDLRTNFQEITAVLRLLHQSNPVALNLTMVPGKRGLGRKQAE